MNIIDQIRLTLGTLLISHAPLLMEVHLKLQRFEFCFNQAFKDEILLIYSFILGRDFRMETPGSILGTEEECRHIKI